LRAIGSTLADYGYETSDPDRKRALTTEAASYLKRAVESMESMEGEVLERVATIRLLAPVCERIDQAPEAIKYYDQAYDLLPDQDSQGISIEELKEIRTVRIGILTAKASVLSAREQVEEALQTFNEARELSGDQPLAGTTLDDITLLFKKDDEAGMRKLMEVLKSWTDKERNSWFSYCFEDWVSDSAVARMQRAAKLTKETDLLLDWLTALAKTLPTQSLYLFNVRGAIASIHYPVLGDIEKGKALRQELLAMKPKPDPWYEETMNETKTRHRMQLADILFYEFQMSADPTKKEAIIETVRLLPSAHDDDNIRGSHVDMVRANMLRIMGPAKEYQLYMNELFTRCIGGLEDGVSWNDLPSLRLLSKVLASLDGLEPDARIAISAQFSILDRAIHGQDTESEHLENLSNKDGGKADVEQQSASEHEPTTESAETWNDPLTDAVRKVADKSPSDEPAEKEQDPAENAEISKPTKPEPAKLEEDIARMSIFCDGQCGASITSWSQPFYYCLVCPSCDLCEDCHSKRLKQTSGDIEEPWLSFCGSNHRYIKGPMKDWRGIKNGVIRFGDKEVTVKEWLRGLKEERWQNAWKIFWTRQGGLKDIGIED
jgi:tetratricopeptide (TPR) repeat protein